MPSQNFFIWHYTFALPQFIKGRQKFLADTFTFLNIAGLLKNLFAPYRRLAVSKDSAIFNIKGVLDRLSFNLISAIIGAIARTLLIAVGTLALIFLSLLSLMIIVFYLIPLFSLPKYLDYLKNTFFEDDLNNPQKFIKKLKATRIFQSLSLFFEDNLASINFTPPPKETSNIQTTAQILSLISQEDYFQKYLLAQNVKGEYFKVLISYLDHHLKRKITFAKPKPLGQILTFGYTPLLDKFGQLIESPKPESYLDQQLLAQIEGILTRAQNNNVLLVGEPGVGRHNLLENLSFAIQNQEVPALSGKNIVILDTVALCGVGKSLIEVKGNFEKVLEDAKNAGNIILAIDQTDRVITSLDGRIDLSEVLTQTLKDGSLPIIGITTIDDFAKYVRPNTNFLKLFEKIDVAEPGFEETLTILTGKAHATFNKEGVATTLAALLEIVQKTNALIKESSQPQKSLVVLEDCLTFAKDHKIKLITPDLIDAVLTQKTKIPVGKITQKEAEKLKNLEAILHQRIIGQDEAITEIARALRRARAEVETGARPIGSFLFLGPTGVGKTETAKALSKVYFGSQENITRLDMSEYQGDDAINRLIDNPVTKDPGVLAKLVREHPFAVLLVDEFEKANPNIHNLFLQILDEGFLTDAFGKKASFDNTIIIATSNAAAEFIREEVLSSPKWQLDQGATLSRKIINYVLEKGLFSPELVNRFDAVVVYHPLTPIEIAQVTALMLADLGKKLKESKNITLEITDELIQKIVAKSYDPTFGARAIRRYIADTIEDQIAKMIIDGSLKNGDKIAASILIKVVS